MPGKEKNTPPITLYLHTLKTPIGPVTLEASRIGIRRITLWGESSSSQDPPPDTPGFPFPQAATQILAYLNGEKRSLDSIPVELSGTPFQRKVWEGIARIPHGELQSYGELARRIGRPRASRAVGQACGANPLPLIIPCHRVVGSGRVLGGFSGGGIFVKNWLLSLEQRVKNL
jgi:methylated-DNA-[protein]-cysteine S-methyltransferase